MLRTAFVIDAALELDDDADPRAPGGAVTVALCGHWEHDGPCRWPHHSDLDALTAPAHLHTVAAAPDDEYDDVVRRVEEELRADGRWTVKSFAVREVGADDAALAANLLRS